MFTNTQLQPYPDVNSILSQIHKGVLAILEDNYLSFILHGSLASGGFDPSRSDVDFLIVTSGEISNAQFDALRSMHQAIASSKQSWSTNVEGSYIPKQAIVRYDSQNCIHPALRTDGSFERDGHGPDWILQRWNIREHGIALFGVEPKSLINPVSIMDMRQAVIGILHSWWEPMLTQEYRLDEPEYQAYAVMTMCRSFYTMETGRIAPKPEAAADAKDKLGIRWGS